MNATRAASSIRGPSRAFLLIALMACCGITPGSAGDSRYPSSARDYYNQGVRQLEEGELADAEAAFFSAIARHDLRIQPPALYNLGIIRFKQGELELEEGPDPKATLEQGQRALQRASEAIEFAGQAMLDRQMNQLISSYFRGRGARKQLKDAAEAVQKALDSYEATLALWQRSVGDFRGATEMNPGDEDAAFNADVVDRHIAQLVDSLQQMMMMAGAIGQMEESLEELLSQLEGMIPEDMAPPGPGEEESDDEYPDSPEPGQEEGPSREGKEQPLSPDDAARLLESFRLDRGRPLPLGLEETQEDQERKGRNW